MDRIVKGKKSENKENIVGVYAICTRMWRQKCCLLSIIVVKNEPLSKNCGVFIIYIDGCSGTTDIDETHIFEKL